jgi:hypothetical protein
MGYQQLRGAKESDHSPDLETEKDTQSKLLEKLGTQFVPSAELHPNATPLQLSASLDDFGFAVLWLNARLIPSPWLLRIHLRTLHPMQHVSRCALGGHWLILSGEDRGRRVHGRAG